jgi:outer membrane protein
MKRLGLCLAIICAPTLAWAEGEVLTLGRVLELVRTDSPALAVARAQEASAEAGVRKAWTAWQPKVDAIGQLQLSSVEQSLDFGAFATPLGKVFLGPTFALTPAQVAQLPEPTVIQPYVQLAAVLSLKQTLFNITALRAPGVAEAGRDAARAGVVAAEDELTFGAAQLFVTLAGLKGLEAATQRAIEVADKRIKDARAQLEAGTSTQLNVTRAETDRASAASQKLSLEAQRRMLLAKLAALLGRTTAVEVSGEAIDTQVVLEAPTEPSPRALVKASEAALVATEKSIGLSDLSWLPTLAAEGNLRYSNVSGFSGDNFVATGTLNLVVPLYDSGARYAETDAARAATAKARAELDRARAEAHASVVEAEAKVESAQAELTLGEAQLRLATEAVAQVEALSGAGLATDLELADADRARFGADQSLAQKRFALDIARIQRVYARGGRLEAKK